jgi:hypothetical protein
MYMSPQGEEHPMAASSQEKSLLTLLPGQVCGWAMSGEDRTYGRATLSDYIDGGAELYLSYDFVHAVARTYSRPEQPDIIFDIFEMASARDAFGAFSLQTETPDSAFGQGSERRGGLLLFWKDRWLVSLLASPETPESRAAVTELANAIDRAIPEKGSLPDLLAYLPEGSLVPGSRRYFHHFVWLNSFYFVSTENILRMDENTEAVLSHYGKGKERAFLLLVRYPDPGAASAARDEFAVQYLQDRTNAAVTKIEDGTWSGCVLEGRILTVVLGAPDEDTALRFLGTRGTLPGIAPAAEKKAGGLQEGEEHAR